MRKNKLKLSIDFFLTLVNSQKSIKIDAIKK